MPTWTITVTTVIVSIVSLWGITMFPLVPMFFGVYKGAQSFREKLLVKLLMGFPLISAVSIYIAWTSNSYFTLIPYAYFVLLWSMRLDKGGNAGPGSVYASKQENLDARLGELDSRWESWTELSAAGKYLLFTFFAPGEEELTPLQSALEQSESLHSPVETASNDNNKTLDVYVRIKLDAIDKKAIVTITERMIDTAWANKCEVSSLDVMEVMD